MSKIEFRPSAKQYRALQYLQDKETEFIGYGGAAFSGKSYLLCYWLLMMGTAYPDTGWGLGRKELTTLKKTTLMTFFKVCAECNFKEGEHYTYNQALNIITFYNKSQIFLIDTAYKPSDPLYTRFGGLELTGAAIDESAETNIEAIEILATRLGRRNNGKYGVPRKMLETFNPAKNHVYSRYYKPYREERQKPGHVFVPALPKDNPSPDVESYIAGILRTGSKVTVERLIYGNFEYDDDPAALCQYDKLTDLFTNDFKTLDGPKYITTDIARFGSDKIVVGLWHGFRVKFKSFTKQSITDSYEYIKKLQKENGVPLSHVVADEDGVGGGLVDMLGCKGFVNNSRALPNPLETDYKKKNTPENYENLQAQCAFRLAERINQNRLFIQDATPQEQQDIIQELEALKQKNMDSDGKKGIVGKDDVKQLIGRSPDYRDMLLMREYFELKPPVKNNLATLSVFQ